MNNRKQIIENHNKHIINSSKHADKPADSASDIKSCNCRQKNACPLNGNCLQSSVIYQATVKRHNTNTSETYIGLTENDFKTRYRNHIASFRHAFRYIQNTGTLQNSANIFGLLKTTTLTTLLHGASFHLAHLTTALVKDVISVLKKNFISSFDPTFHPYTNVTKLYLLAATETKCCYVTAKHFII